MSKILVVFFIWTQIILAQNKRFIYQYSFIPDSTNKANIMKEFMFLDIAGGESLFYSNRKFIEDSTSIAEAKKGNFYIPNADILYRIKKSKGKVFYMTTDYGLNKIMVEDKRVIVWEIQPEMQKIGEYNAQKAITYFGGRKWITWFTEDIPIQDGPYKFCGLPGLIIKIEDATKSHNYELVGIKNITGETKYPELSSGSKVLVLTEERFRDLFIKYRKDPAADTRQLYIEGKIPDYRDSSGNFRTGAEVIKDVERLSKERVKKDNNIIEIDLLN